MSTTFDALPVLDTSHDRASTIGQIYPTDGVSQMKACPISLESHTHVYFNAIIREYLDHGVQEI